MRRPDGPRYVLVVAMNRFQKRWFARRERAQDKAEAVKSLDETSKEKLVVTERFTEDPLSVR
jgi:hypothetical protein